MEKDLDIIRYLTKQGLSLRGHDETDESKNKGNFYELFELFSKYDKTFSE